MYQESLLFHPSKAILFSLKTSRDLKNKSDWMVITRFDNKMGRPNEFHNLPKENWQMFVNVFAMIILNQLQSIKKIMKLLQFYMCIHIFQASKITCWWLYTWIHVQMCYAFKRIRNTWTGPKILTLLPTQFKLDMILLQTVHYVAFLCLNNKVTPIAN